ncbi:hypothetical protein TNCV_1543181 [Trichonephila clavipes]|nr:hypothetical protein TNCV_1543181 [Trichonephila clavipes]
MLPSCTNAILKSAVVIPHCGCVTVAKSLERALLGYSIGFFFKGHDRELTTGGTSVESWVQILVPLKTNHVKGLMNVNSVETQSPQPGVEVGRVG